MERPAYSVAENLASTPLRALWIWVQRLFGVDVVTARKVKDVFENWLEGGGGGIAIA